MIRSGLVRYGTGRVMCNQAPASNISGCWQSLEGIQHNMLNFLENHDEQRIASYFFAGDPRPGIPGMIVSAMMNTNPVMIYSGQELGEPGMDDEGSADVMGARRFLITGVLPACVTG